MKKIWFASSLILFLFVVFTYFFVDLNFIYLQGLYTGLYRENRLILTFVYFILIFLMFVCYGKILKNNVQKHDKKLFLIPILGILAYPAALSFDLFNYIATAKVAFHYFENPYIVMPIEFVNEPVLIFTRATNKIALYAPLWTFISGLPYSLSFGNYLAAIVLFKIFISFFYFGVLKLIHKITGDLKSVLYFAASPLVIIETFVSGHNDVVMMFFALLSVYFLKNKKILLALLFLLCSFLIKYATVFLIPLFVYYFYKKMKNQEIDRNKFYFAGFILMLIVFFLSPLREEIYPWYAIWPLTFLTLTNNKFAKTVFAVFTFGLMLRYIPYMLTGDYFGLTPVVKISLTFIPPALYLAYSLIGNKIRK